MALSLTALNACLATGAKVAFVSTYTPNACGIATFTNDLRDATIRSTMYMSHEVIAVDDADREYPSEVSFVIKRDDFQSYLEAAAYVNDSSTEVVSLQHEYGIFGGNDGEYILSFVKALSVPFVPTLHTILQKPSEGQHKVLAELCELSAGVMVMSDRARFILSEVYGCPLEKIDVIPHGVPDSENVEADPYMMSFGDAPKLLTFGLIGPSKGIEVAIKGVAEIKKKHENIKYFVLGATHPVLKKRDGEAYRESLQALVKELELEDNVIFVDEFASLDKLSSCLKAADIYVTPYTGREQICSGTLSYAVGFGLPIVSTPYIYAEELVEKGGGLLFPFGDYKKMAHAVDKLLGDPRFCGRMRASATMLGRTMRWPEVGRKLNRMFCDILAEESSIEVLFAASDPANNVTLL